MYYMFYRNPPETEKITDISVLKEKALQWKRYDYEYSSIHEKVDWS